jgi:hypothetical protein
MPIGLFDWNAAAAIASAVSAIAAALSAFLSYRSMKTASIISKEQRASQATLQFIDLSLKHKTLSTTNEGEDYEWYVIAVLEFAREVLAAYPNDAGRRNQMREQLAFHREELANWNKQDIKNYGLEVLALVDEVLKDDRSKVVVK